LFFGTFVPRESKVGKRLRRLFDAHDGQTSVEGVEFGMCGSASGSPLFMTIAGVDLSFDKSCKIQAPRPLPNATGWAERIGLFLAAEGISMKDVAPIGWHFEGSEN
jgi:hypothetical protein